MRTKRIISMILIITLMFSFSASVYADSDSIAESLKNIMTNIKNIIEEVIKIFMDIKESDWFAENVSMLYKLGIINGKPQKDGTVLFDPKGLVTKSEFTKMLVTAMKYNIVDGNTFKDIGYEKHWAKKYIETAIKEGVIDPEKEGEYYWPDIPIKRFDMAMMMFKALKLEYSNNPTPFPDVDCGCVTKLYEEYLINGVPNGGKVYFSPSGLTTRAEAAAIIARMIEYKEDPVTYKAKKEKEAKEKEFIEPELVIKYQDVDWGGTYFRVGIRNIFDYDYHYMFKIECINDDRLNWAQMPGYDPVYTVRWIPYSQVARNYGQLYNLQSAYIGTEKDRNGERDLPINEGDKFDFKVTIIKTKEGKPITERNYEPTTHDNYKEYYISGIVDLDAFKDDPEYNKAESEGVIPWNQRK